MKKQVVFLVIVVLVIGLIVTGVSLTQKNTKLIEAEAKISDLQGTVATLQVNVSSLQGNVSSLQKSLADSQATVSTLRTDLQTANVTATRLQADIKAQQDLNSTLSAQVKTMQYPRHFSSLAELTGWLQKDDTNTKYASVLPMQRAFILEAMAARDGYLLPVRVPLGATNDYIINAAVIGDVVWSVKASDDLVDRLGDILPTVPTTLPLQ